MAGAHESEAKGGKEGDTRSKDQELGQWDARVFTSGVRSGLFRTHPSHRNPDPPYETDCRRIPSDEYRRLPEGEGRRGETDRDPENCARSNPRP